MRGIRAQMGPRLIPSLQRQVDQHRADLTHIDGVLRVLAADLDPNTIRPKRAYRRNRYFAMNELSRLCVAYSEPQRVSCWARMISRAGWSRPSTSISETRLLRAAIREQVGSTVKRLHRDREIENIGARRASKWKLAGF
jgi:hypothetical protein